MDAEEFARLVAEVAAWQDMKEYIFETNYAQMSLEWMLIEPHTYLWRQRTQNAFEDGEIVVYKKLPRKALVALLDAPMEIS